MRDGRDTLHTAIGESKTIYMKRRKDIIAFLDKADKDLQLIAERYKNLSVNKPVPEELKVDIHDFLTKNRAVLDYLAHEIYDLCKSEPKRLYFPIAQRDETITVFNRRLTQLFPNLKTTIPKLYEYLIEIQYYHEIPWLLEFQEIVNTNKHDCLSRQVPGEFISVWVHFNGIGPRVGELGYKSIIIEKGGTLKLGPKDGESRSIRGPQVIDVNMTGLNDADPGIKIERVTWSSFKIDGIERSAVGLLRIIYQGVTRCYERVDNLIKENKLG